MEAVGLYGLIAYSTAQRTAELGIRVAFGASTGKVLQLVLREALLFGCVGVAIGIAAGVGVAQGASSFLYSLSAVDPYAFLGAAAMLIGSALTAACVPATARIDAATVLRHE